MSTSADYIRQLLGMNGSPAGMAAPAGVAVGAPQQGATAAQPSTTGGMAGGISDQQLAQILGGISAAPEQNNALKQQITLADQLRQKSPQGIQAGRVYVAPKWTSYAGQALNNYATDKMAQNATNEQMGLANQQQDARSKAMLKALQEWATKPGANTNSSNIDEDEDMQGKS